MQYGIDPVACILALMAFAFAWRVERRNNTSVVKILHCTGGRRSSANENDFKMYTHFTILLRNLGISLHSPAVGITFGPIGGDACVSILLKRTDETPDGISEFARGMIAEFSFKSYELSDKTKDLLASLEDPAKQDARLLVYSQGYLSRQVRIGGWKDRISAAWNDLAYRIERLIDRRAGRNDIVRDTLKLCRFLPTFGTLNSPLATFTDALRLDAYAKVRGAENLNGPHISDGREVVPGRADGVQNSAGSP
jgi:hypothetical protein